MRLLQVRSVLIHGHNVVTIMRAGVLGRCPRAVYVERGGNQERSLAERGQTPATGFQAGCPFQILAEMTSRTVYKISFKAVGCAYFAWKRSRRNPNRGRTKRGYGASYAPHSGRVRCVRYFYAVGRVRRVSVKPRYVVGQHVEDTEQLSMSVSGWSACRRR